MNGTTTCRGCGAPILWGKSENTGRPIPLDPETGANHLIACPEKQVWARKKTTPAGPRAVFVPGSGWVVRR